MAEQPAQAPAAAPVKKEKIVPPSPPLKIRDRDRGYEYMRVGFLGEGGFARVYEVQDQRASRRAVKVVSKASIKTKKNKTKLWAEIKLHQMLAHPNINYVITAVSWTSSVVEKGTPNLRLATIWCSS